MKHQRRSATERARLALTIGATLTACDASEHQELSAEHYAEPRTANLPGDCLEPMPPPPGPCTVHVELESIYIGQGQGISEGDLELTVEATTTGSDPVTWPAGAESQRMDVHSQKSISQLVGTHTLGHNGIAVIDVCTEVTEIDNGGFNGQSDVGRACEPVPISCHMSPRTVELQTLLCKRDSSPCKANGSTTTTFRVSISDEDGDGIENDVDMAPTRCSDHPQVLGQSGRAVLAFFHIPDQTSFGS